MKEILTVQIGDYGNFVASQFWNIQRAYFEDGAFTSDFSDVSDMIYECQGSSHGQNVYIPRTTVVDLSSNISMRPSFAEDFLPKFDSSRANYSDIFSMKDLGATSSGISTSFSSMINPVLPWRVHAGEESRRSSLGLSKYRTLVSESQGIDAFKNDGIGERVEDNVRRWAERSDTVGGLQMFVDCGSGWSGFAKSFLTDVWSDLYGKKCVMIYDTTRDLSIDGSDVDKDIFGFFKRSIDTKQTDSTEKSPEVLSTSLSLSPFSRVNRSFMYTHLSLQGMSHALMVPLSAVSAAVTSMDKANPLWSRLDKFSTRKHNPSDAWRGIKSTSVDGSLSVSAMHDALRSHCQGTELESSDISESPAYSLSGSIHSAHGLIFDTSSDIHTSSLLAQCIDTISMLYRAKPWLQGGHTPSFCNMDTVVDKLTNVTQCKYGNVSSAFPSFLDTREKDLSSVLVQGEKTSEGRRRFAALCENLNRLPTQAFTPLHMSGFMMNRHIASKRSVYDQCQNVLYDRPIEELCNSKFKYDNPQIYQYRESIARESSRLSVMRVDTLNSEKAHAASKLRSSRYQGIRSRDASSVASSASDTSSNDYLFGLTETNSGFQSALSRAFHSSSLPLFSYSSAFRPRPLTTRRCVCEWRSNRSPSAASSAGTSSHKDDTDHNTGLGGRFCGAKGGYGDDMWICGRIIDGSKVSGCEREAKEWSFLRHKVAEQEREAQRQREAEEKRKRQEEEEEEEEERRIQEKASRRQGGERKFTSLFSTLSSTFGDSILGSSEKEFDSGESRGYGDDMWICGRIIDGSKVSGCEREAKEWSFLRHKVAEQEREAQRQREAEEKRKRQEEEEEEEEERRIQEKASRRQGGERKFTSLFSTLSSTFGDSILGSSEKEFDSGESSSVDKWGSEAFSGWKVDHSFLFGGTQVVPPSSDSSSSSLLTTGTNEAERKKDKPEKPLSPLEEKLIARRQEQSKTSTISPVPSHCVHPATVSSFLSLSIDPNTGEAFQDIGTGIQQWCRGKGREYVTGIEAFSIDQDEAEEVAEAAFDISSAYGYTKEEEEESSEAW
ncbi:hypothetical protein ADUPG1_009002 [Aduncisulcus paluster]|uniref:Misato Segment II tubulin-like domain-containing protein n=1 Tax=Aduncisulcus paluster TaxID=2918883 RepID=A0ABQ5KVA9_9EUKA|nr:hypothetical protein ADUPG1_009002 [Aduncisulcus paluster]